MSAHIHECINFRAMAELVRLLLAEINGILSLLWMDLVKWFSDICEP
jgi:hypothetical protein